MVAAETIEAVKRETPKTPTIFPIIASSSEEFEGLNPHRSRSGPNDPDLEIKMLTILKKRLTVLILAGFHSLDSGRPTKKPGGHVIQSEASAQNASMQLNITSSSLACQWFLSSNSGEEVPLQFSGLIRLLTNDAHADNQPMKGRP